MPQTGSIISESVAVIDAHELRQLVSEKNAFLGAKLSSALGTKKLFATEWERLDESDDPDTQRQVFFGGVVAGANEFKTNLGLYIHEDVANAFVHDAVIAKLSVTAEDPKFGGVFVAVIPASESLNGLIVSSGGIQTPAFVDGTGITVLTREDTFRVFGETLNAVSKIVESGEKMDDGTNWHTGAHLSVSFYKISEADEDVTFLHEYVVRDANEEKDFKQSASFYPDGHVSKWEDYLQEWTELGYPGTDIDGFVYLSERKFSELIGAAEASAPKANRSFGIVGSDETAATEFAASKEVSVETNFAPILFEGIGPNDTVPAVELESGEQYDASETFADEFIDDESELAVEPAEAPYEDFENNPEAWDENALPQPVSSFGGAQEWVDEVNVSELSEDTHSTGGDEIQRSIEYAEALGFGDDLATAAEFLVTHSEPHVNDGTVDFEHNDATAETTEPFELGAEYLIENSIDDGALQPHVDEPIDLSWDELDSSIAASDETVFSGDAEVTDDDFEFFWTDDEIATSEPATTPAEPDSEQSSTPAIRSFLTPPTE